ncbi:hypothetical protein [Mucilaginibacter paludis]|uniref:Uncharacterized protein n=1 Tax=Mucilaginibacter paludis DSM 18603 TaxID=714943 RepID=H1Y3Z4_9SPHI|nr:hypothetical protein [Mucilaginibacter paludis]EHQ30939.1 hypothetical protein Mucpa_6890 [Mucilaginibacter paludis DSM 18603]
MDTTKIHMQTHQGLQLKSVMDLLNVSIDDLGKGLNLKRAEVVELITSTEIDDAIITAVAVFLNIPVAVIRNFKYDLPFQPNILSENNTIINYNHCINQNSIESIAKIYEIVRDLVKKENGSK